MVKAAAAPLAPTWAEWAPSPPETLLPHSNSTTLCSPPPWASFPLNRSTSSRGFPHLPQSLSRAIPESAPAGRRPLHSTTRGSLGGEEKPVRPVRDYRGIRKHKSLQLSVDSASMHSRVHTRSQGSAPTDLCTPCWVHTCTLTAPAANCTWALDTATGDLNSSPAVPTGQRNMTGCVCVRGRRVLPDEGSERGRNLAEAPQQW